jgi:hypothetical protein
MAAERKVIDISDASEIARLVDEVRRDGNVRILRRDGADVAILAPLGEANIGAPTRVYSEEDDESFLSTFGSWSDVDTDKLIEEIYERRRPSKPPVEF